MPKMTTLRYKCTCMKEEIAFDMPARRFNEDVLDFMERVKSWLGDHHSQYSPFCRATEVEYLKIPIPGDDRPIGSSPQDAN